MKLPKRDDNHVMETKSARLLQALAPDDWILREVSERDYGIDFYIELSNHRGEITGDLLSVQLKSENEINWRTNQDGSTTARSPSIHVSTANYWLRLPVPVLLFVADLAAKDIYICSVKPSLRTQYKKLDSQDSVSFTLDHMISLSSDLGKMMTRAFYLQERTHPRFETYLTALLSNIKSHSEFIHANQGLDNFLEVEAPRHLEFRALYNACATVADYLGIRWDIPKLIDVYREDHKVYQNDYCCLHEGSLGNVLAKIESYYLRIIKESLKIVTESQECYWRKTSPFFFSLCSDGELQAHIRDVEALFARSGDSKG